MLNLKFYKMNEEVLSPKYATEKSACFDLYAWIPPEHSFDCFTPSNKKIVIKSDRDSQLILKSNDRVLIPTGLIFQIPEGYSMRVHMRSSVPLKIGLVMPNSQGIIDEDYFHQTYLIISNTLPMQSTVITNGMKLCQAELVKVNQVSFEEIFEAPTQTTSRIGGIGSTGQ
jgi:dUTP pyrophosphatase